MKLVKTFVEFAAERVRSGDYGNNFGKNQIAEVLFRILTEFLMKEVSE